MSPPSCHPHISPLLPPTNNAILATLGHRLDVLLVLIVLDDDVAQDLLHGMLRKLPHDLRVGRLPRLGALPRHMEYI